MEESDKYMNDELVSAIKAARMLEPWKVEFRISDLYISTMTYLDDCDFIGMFDIGNN